VRVAGAQRADRSVDDRLRRGKIRVADAHEDNILAASPGGERGIVDFPGSGALAAE
jgi:hypothetical protein